MDEPFLDVDDLCVGYGDGIVISNLSFSIPAGGSVAVLGRNGVGKSTLVLAIAGHLRPRSGRIRLRGKEITALPPERRCWLGIGWVPQEREVFAPLTVDEHLRIAAASGPWTIPRVYELFPRLADRRRHFGDQLSGGEQQMLAIGRALVTNPKLLLLDEPLEGLAPVVAQDVARCIREVARAEGMSVILIEQHAGFALKLADQAIILERGLVVRRGTSDAIARDHDALEQYVGVRKAGKKPAVKRS